MRKNLRALTLIEFVAVAGILPVVLGAAVSSLARFRELNKRIVCSINLKGIGAAARIYANDYQERWMIPPFLFAQAIDLPSLPGLSNRLVNFTIWLILNLIAHSCQPRPPPGLPHCKKCMHAKQFAPMQMNPAIITCFSGTCTLARIMLHRG